MLFYAYLPMVVSSAFRSVYLLSIVSNIEYRISSTPSSSLQESYDGDHLLELEQLFLMCVLLLKSTTESDTSTYELLHIYHTTVFWRAVLVTVSKWSATISRLLSRFS
jgi:hypothetical protein